MDRRYLALFGKLRRIQHGNRNSLDFAALHRHNRNIQLVKLPNTWRMGGEHHCGKRRDNGQRVEPHDHKLRQKQYHHCSLISAASDIHNNHDIAASQRAANLRRKLQRSEQLYHATRRPNIAWRHSYFRHRIIMGQYVCVSRKIRCSTKTMKKCFLP